MPSLRLLAYALIIAVLACAIAALRFLEPGSGDPPDNGQFFTVALQSANERRQENHLSPLKGEVSLQQMLQSFVESGKLDSLKLNGIFSFVERQAPQVHEVAANLVFAGDETQLLERLNEWADLQMGDYSHFATWIYRQPGKRGVGCLALVAEELPPLSLPTKPSGHPTYYSQCRFCENGHGVSFGSQEKSTLIVSCPHCDSEYNLIATDSEGNWRRANQFFAGMHSPVVTSDMSEMEQVLAIWKDVASKCRYRMDAERILGGDSWEDPRRTYRVGSGDCEDTSILLADMLITEGFDARVALGDHEGIGHAWCVVRLGGKDYLLESTWKNIDSLDEPPLLDDVGIDYAPSFLFDRDGIYFRRLEGWTGDYWSRSNWRQVSYPAEGTMASTR